MSGGTLKTLSILILGTFFVVSVDSVYGAQNFNKLTLNQKRAYVRSSLQDMFKSLNLQNLYRDNAFMNTIVERISKDYLSASALPSTKKLIHRSQLFLPLIERSLSNKIPPYFKYLPVVESAMNPRAVNKDIYDKEGNLIQKGSGAAGLWQFMSKTAQSYQLKVDGNVDERFDIILSTKMAEQYLADLYSKYRQCGARWDHVISAYNAGPETIRKAQLKALSSEKNCKIEEHLPVETQNYLPKFFAATFIMLEHKYLGLTEQPIEDFAPLNTYNVLAAL